MHMTTLRKTRMAVLAAVGVASAIAMAGCSTAESSGASGQALTVATDNVSQLKPVVQAFEAANPGVKVDLQAGGESADAYNEFLRTRIASDSAPDVFRTFPGFGNVAGVGELASANALADLSGESWAGTLNAGQRSEFGSKGKVLAVPIGSLALGPVYDEQTLAAVGATIPTTYDQVLQLCDAAKAHGKVAYAFFNKGGNVLPSYALTASLVYGPHADFTAEQLAGKASFAKSGWVDAFRIIDEMNHRGCFNDSANGTDPAAAFNLVGKGDAVAVFWFADTTAIADVSPKGTTLTLAPLPTGENADNQYLAVANSAGFAVNAKAKHADLAKRFVGFLATAKAQNLFAKASSGAPALPNDEFKPATANQALIAKYVSDGRVGPWPDQGWPGAEVQQTLNDVMQTLITGQETPEGAAKKMDDAFAKANAH